MIVIKLTLKNEENLQKSESIIIDSGEKKNDIINQKLKLKITGRK